MGGGGKGRRRKGHILLRDGGDIRCFCLPLAFPEPPFPEEDVEEGGQLVEA